jgi:hypothetical protein
MRNEKSTRLPLLLAAAAGEAKVCVGNLQFTWEEMPGFICCLENLQMHMELRAHGNGFDAASLPRLQESNRFPTPKSSRGDKNHKGQHTSWVPWEKFMRQQRMPAL